MIEHLLYLGSIVVVLVMGLGAIGAILDIMGFDPLELIFVKRKKRILRRIYEKRLIRKRAKIKVLMNEEPEETVDEDPLAFWESLVEEKGKLEWGNESEIPQKSWNSIQAQKQLHKVKVSDIDFLKEAYKKLITSDMTIEAKKRKRRHD